MSLREKQSIFAKNFALLVIHAYEIGYEITYGEGQRTGDQQLLYFEGFSLKKIGSSLKLFKSNKRSKTMSSDHLLKCAHDINVFIDGDYKTDKETYKPLHEYWVSLHPKNYSGYQWGWDYNHFGMK